jgi:hypothetical protein
MNSDFEKKLVEQPLRATPAAWRGAILREARDAAAQQALHTPAATGWRSWFWPAPQAWAALAACWLVLLAVHALDRAPATTGVAQVDATRLALALAEKRHALLDLDVAVVAQQARPAAPRLPRGASGWLRDEKGMLPC